MVNKLGFCSGYDFWGLCFYYNRNFYFVNKLTEKAEKNKIGFITKSNWCIIKHCATKRNLSFDITPQQINDLYIKQDKKCALTGWPIILGSRKRKEDTASLDRIDGSKGYSIDNVQWVNREINRLKNNWSDSRFIELCEAVTNYSKSKEKEKDG